jgi:hypothetical protein
MYQIKNYGRHRRNHRNRNHRAGAQPILTAETTEIIETTVQAQPILIHYDSNGQASTVCADAEGLQSPLLRLVRRNQVSSFVLKCIIVF